MQKQSITRITGLHGAAKALEVCALHDTHSKIAIITKNEAEADIIIKDLQFFNPNVKTIYLEPSEKIPLEAVSPSLSWQTKRIKNLFELNSSSSFIAVIPSRTLLETTIDKELLTKQKVSINKSCNLSRTKIQSLLNHLGMIHSSSVTNVGTFCIRGSVIDFYSPAAELPTRLSFLGETLSSIRSFDSETQRSINEIEEVQLIPARELNHFFAPVVDVELIKNRAKELEVSARELARVSHAIKHKGDIPGIEEYAAINFTERSNILNWLSNDSNLILDNEVTI